MSAQEAAEKDVLEFLAAVLRQFPLKERAELEMSVGIFLKMVMAKDFRDYAVMLRNRIIQAEESVPEYEALEKKHLELLARYNVLMEKCESLGLAEINNLDLDIIELNKKVQNQKVTINLLTEQRDKYRRMFKEMEEGLNSICYVQNRT